MMKRWMVPTVFVVVAGLGSYVVLAQQDQSSDMSQQGMMGGGMGGGMMQQGGMMGRGGMQGQGGMMQGRGMGRGIMHGPGGTACMGCIVASASMLMQSVTATSDGGVVVAAGGKLIKYDASLRKVAEMNVAINWNEVQRRVEQMMENCPIHRRMMGGPQGRFQGPPQGGFQGQPQGQFQGQPPGGSQGQENP
jgi:hypothetical protein